MQSSHTFKEKNLAACLTPAVVLAAVLYRINGSRVDHVVLRPFSGDTHDETHDEFTAGTVQGRMNRVVTPELK